MESRKVMTSGGAFADGLESVIEDGDWVGEKKEITDFVVEMNHPQQKAMVHDLIEQRLNDFHGPAEDGTPHLDVVSQWTFPKDPSTGLTGQLSPNTSDGEYYRRLCKCDKGNQLESMVEKIKQWGRNNRTVAQVFKSHRDLNAMFPPCLMDISALYRDGDVNLTAHYRSHTLVKSYYGDILSLARLQKWLAERVDAGCGGITVFSNSLHIRKKNDEHELAQELYEELVA